MIHVDITIVGAGVVGLAVACALAEKGRSIVVLEKESGPGKETSSRNSEVIHAGIYYPTGSLKARLCIEGSHLLYAFCERHTIPFKESERSSWPQALLKSLPLRVFADRAPKTALEGSS